MKKIFSFMMVAMMAASMVSFVACSKDDDDKDNGGNNTPAEAAANTLVVDGKVYQLNSRFSVEQRGRGYVDAESIEQDAEGVTLYNIRGDVDDNSENRSFDLTRHYADADYAFGVNNSDDSFSFSQDNHTDAEPGFYGTVNGQNFDEGAFTSGTLTITRTDNLFTYKLTGTLRNGTTVSFHLSIPSAEWEILEW